MSTIRRHLAAETRALHDAVDAAAGDGGRDVPALFATMARGVVAVESALDRIDAARLLPEWPTRRRAPLVDAPPAVPAVDLASDAEAWGALYVLEGSRLGGRVLRRANDDLAAHPFFGEETPFWSVFLDRLVEADATLGDRDGMVSGARKAFAAFL